LAGERTATCWAESEGPREKYRLQGKENPGKRAWLKIKEQRPQSYQAWQRLNFFSMQAIDKCLEEQGLPRKHF